MTRMAKLQFKDRQPLTLQEPQGHSDILNNTYQNYK